MQRVCRKIHFLTQQKPNKKKLLNTVNNRDYEYGLNTEKRDQQIIVSMTSYKPRFNTICLAIKSILLQNVKPDKFIVWLDANTHHSDLTQEMIDLQKYGVEYRFMDINLRPHNKYYFALKEFPNAIVITVDDDNLYPLNLIELLLKKHIQYPDCVCARLVHKVTFNKDGSIAPYSQWNRFARNIKKPSSNLVALGVGGVLYPPHCLDKRALDANLIQKYCLNADDIWLKAMELLHGTKVVWVKTNMTMPVDIEDSQQIRLESNNVFGSQNDTYIKNLYKVYSEEIKAGDFFVR